MRFHILLAVVATFVYADHKTDFCNSASRFIVFWNPNNIGALATFILTDIGNLKTMSQIGSNCMGYVTNPSVTPLMSMFSLLNVKNQMDANLKACASTAMAYLGKLLPALMIKLEKPYKLMITQVKKMNNYSQTAAYKLDKLFDTARASCTRNLIEHMLDSAIDNSTQCEWIAAVKSLPAIFNLTGFDLTYTPK